METINDLGKYTFPALLNNSIKKFGERPAVTLVGGSPYTYAQFGQKLNRLQKCFTLWVLIMVQK